MSTDEERELREKINRLNELFVAISNRLVAEKNKIYTKQQELLSIENELRTRYGWPGVATAVWPGTYLLGKYGREFREQLEKLLQRREYLINEIEKERKLITKLTMDSAKVAKNIQELTSQLAQITKVITARRAREEERRRVQREVEWLLEELKEARRVGDTRRVNEIVRRLRELGFPV